MSFQTKLRNKNRGYMNLIVWQRATDLFQLAWQLTPVTFSDVCRNGLCCIDQLRSKLEIDQHITVSISRDSRFSTS
jgi:hypothetical protein